MRLRLALLILPFMLLAADDQKAGGKPPQSASAAAGALPAGVPAGAVRVGPYSWRHTDSEGTVWIYRKTPFGITRIEQVASKSDEELPAGLRAVQAGDEIWFERPGPFGVTRWSRKTDQLTDIERKVWERDRPKAEQPAGDAGAKPKAKE